MESPDTPSGGPERPDDDPMIDDTAIDEEAEAEAAAREAAEIGGPDPNPGVDPAERPVVEGGGGVAEGFEEAERELEERATHQERGGDPAVDADPRSESAETGSEYGEADDVRSQEERR